MCCFKSQSICVICLCVARFERCYYLVDISVFVVYGHQENIYVQFKSCCEQTTVLFISLDELIVIECKGIMINETVIYI